MLEVKGVHGEIAEDKGDGSQILELLLVARWVDSLGIVRQCVEDFVVVLK